MYTVYKHTAPNGKVYIGITSLPPEHRWNKGRGYSNNYHFFNAIIKYGWDNITHAVLHSGLAQEDALHIEAQLIAQYHSDDPQYGYNNSAGGTVPTKRQKAICQYTMSGELIAEYPSLINACQITGANPGSVSHACNGKRKAVNGYLWKYKNDGTELIIPVRHKTTKLAKSKKISVDQYDKEGNLIASYDSIAEAHAKTGINAACICLCCKGDNSTANIKRKTAGGYVWKYAE
jgi:hypothetical protein